MVQLFMISALQIAATSHHVTLAGRHQLGRVPLSHCPIHLHPLVLQPSVSCILTTFSALENLSNHPLELGLEAGDVLHQARLPGH